MMVPNDWPPETPEVLVNGYARSGQFVEANDDGSLALYFFVGDYVAGESFEAWLDSIEARDAQALREALAADFGV